MKNMIDICKEFGLEIPADKVADFNKAVAENYKTIAEHDKKVSKLQSDLDAQRTRADTAEETLKGFEGIDPAKIQSELDGWKQKAENAEKEYNQKLEQRDFDDALKTALDGMKFTSTAARKAVEADIRAAGLKMRNGSIMGLNDVIEQIKKDDASAFVDEHQQNLETNRARFTQPQNRSNGNPTTLTKQDIMKIKDPVERQRLIGQNMGLFQKGE